MSCYPLCINFLVSAKCKLNCAYEMTHHVMGHFALLHRKFVTTDSCNISEGFTPLETMTLICNNQLLLNI